MNTAYISLGSNMGDRESYLEKAINILGSHGKIEVTKRSSMYETDPVGFTEQDQFLNMVIEIRTSLSPETLLHQCLQVEIDLGREREFKWGPRIIDLDILLYNRLMVESEDLLIPHPRMQERAFVLIPLLEVAPRIEHPSINAPFVEFLDEIPDREGVRLWKQINGEDAFVHSES
ncbi:MULTISPECIES: 2-amino-4-hydroxy-6-hydroxymethyldihydropteridine diphosphokinase [Bacillaceae]|uniref:2-amino-4-hydroxy-6- hydroxymethyldihydropteridine diphosphokinase n=1 Tax=Bacillaceae TaxID=186817 RepID=UPI001C56E7B5|nr:2-amino-4-hydroxy-6-hydroxymethyldihydropteridine diphosphokinase [Rossellomorea sp. YZS02]MBW3114738.1 2-amino-4-hydroxy-6-hydroxymethyldihydropteridine diphosphokinase [Bacillus sp. MCCB 382]MDX8345964.1 2-amino-4-hydroxy-6-hydroxymethyldihydropteridine diphosphokinase [Rossellomorea sp. YZS02]